MHSTSVCGVSARCGHRELNREVIYKCPCLPVTDAEMIRDELPVILFFQGCFACRWREVSLALLGQGYLLPHLSREEQRVAWPQGNEEPECLFFPAPLASPDGRAPSA